MLRKMAVVVAMIAPVWAICLPAQATSLAVVGLFRDKAVVSIDGAAPRTLAAGQSVGDVRLLGADSAGAIFSVGGQRRVMKMGQSFVSGPTAAARASVTLNADAQGHFSAGGEINGLPMNFLVDTGASAVTIDADTARRLGIDYRAGTALEASTANGVLPAWRVSFARVKIGDVVLNQIDGIVLETRLAQPLLGMSFLNRMEMRREGAQMTLTRRY